MSQLDSNEDREIANAKGCAVYGVILVILGNGIAFMAWLNSGTSVPSDAPLFAILVVKFIIPMSFTGCGLVMFVWGLVGILKNRE